MIKDSKKYYMEKKKQQLTEKDVNQYFFRLVKSLSTPEKQQTFDVRPLRPDNTDTEIAEELADFFNRISAEFDPLQAGQVPITRDRTATQPPRSVCQDKAF